MSALSPLQERVLEALAGMSPPWTLFGGGALVGFVLHHRTTTDLDLCFRDRAMLGDVVRVLEDKLLAPTT